MSKKIRIGIIVDEIAPGSAPKLIGWPVKELSKLGYSCQAIVIARNDSYTQHSEIYDFHLKGVSIKYITDTFPKIVNKLNFKFPGMSFFSLHHVASFLFGHRVVESGQFDILIAHCQYTTFAARSIKSRWGIPFITLIWDPSTFTARKIYRERFGILYPLLFQCAKWLDRFALAKCESVITSGAFHHSHLRKLTDRKLNVLYPGCFPAETLPTLEDREEIILSFDRWDIGNDPEMLLHVMKAMKNQTASLVVGGFWHPDTMYQEFKEKVHQYGLTDRVQLLGPFNESDIVAWASRSRVHLHPIHEAFGMQSLEVSACGCPSVVPAGSGVCELFEHGVSGYHPEAGDIEAMADCCDKLLESDEHWRDVSHNCFVAARKHDWAAHAERIVEIAKDAIAAK